MNKKLLISISIFYGVLNAACSTALPDCSRSDCTISQNLFQFRSLSSYSSNEIFMLKTMYQNEIKREFWQGTFAAAPQYMQNFNDASRSGCSSLGSLPFWSGSNVMTYGNHNGTTDVDQYQFGMGDSTTTGTIELDAQVTHVGADMLLHMVYHKDKPGFYFTIRAPLGALSTAAILKEDLALPNEIADAETTGIWLDYPSSVTRFKSMLEAFQAGGINRLDSGLSIQSSLHRPFALENGRVAPCKETAIRLADISLALGYQFIATPRGFLGGGIKFTCPTGNVPAGRFLLEPIFGRCGYWGVGVELLNHYKVWEHPTIERGLDFWAKGEILHLCSGRRPNMRSFDLRQNGPGSKYLLLQKYSFTIPSTINAYGAWPSFLTQAVNITTLPVISRFNLEGSFAFLFDVHERNLNLALGAEMWGRSQEHLNLDACHLLHVNAADISQFAVVGRQVSSDARQWNQNSNKEILYLYLCEPLARINNSVDRVVNPDSSAVPTKPYPEGVADARILSNRIPADLNQALDIQAAQAPRAVSIRLFSQLGYTCRDRCLTPQISMIGSLEFSPFCNHAALSMWSLGAQGSINF
jgi:hypothetical protein